jgi:hypothetical protein
MTQVDGPASPSGMRPRDAPPTAQSLSIYRHSHLARCAGLWGRVWGKMWAGPEEMGTGGRTHRGGTTDPSALAMAESRDPAFFTYFGTIPASLP